MTKHSINWFEIPAADFERALTFYGNIFDFEMPKMEMGPHLMGFLPHEQGKGIGGSIIHGEGYVPSQKGTVVYLNGGADLNTILSRVEGAGGKIELPKTQVTPEIGFVAFFIDTEGNKIGLHSPK